MSCVLEMLRARCWPRVAALALTTIGVAACSGDASRFNESPFSSAMHSRGDRLDRARGRRSVGWRAGRLLRSPAQFSCRGPERRARRLAARARPCKGPTQARANAAGAPDAARSVVRKPAPNGNWSWDGGTAITVAPGETVDAIARRYGVPASVIMQANNIASPAIIYPGQRLVIPRYTQAPVAPRRRPPPVRLRPTRVRVRTRAGRRRDARRAMPASMWSRAGDTLSKIARRYNKPANEIAKANNIQSTATLNVGDRLVIPGAQAAAVKPNAPAVGRKPSRHLRRR